MLGTILQLSEASIPTFIPPKLQGFLWRIAQLAERQIVDLQDSGSEPDSPPRRRKQGALYDDVCVVYRTALLLSGEMSEWSMVAVC